MSVIRSERGQLLLSQLIKIVTLLPRGCTHSGHARSAHQRIGLAGRTTEQHPVARFSQYLVNPIVEAYLIDLSQSRIPDMLLSTGPLWKECKRAYLPLATNDLIKFVRRFALIERAVE